VRAAGPQAQGSPREPAEDRIVSSGPVVLSVRPLSDYQLQIVDAVRQLRADGWNDRQIANHFNALGWLTPRGHRWTPQHVFSVRRKAEVRKQRSGLPAEEGT